jgi:hypothetical protein
LHPIHADHDAPQRSVPGALLDAHPRLVGVEDLVAQLADVPRVSEVIRVFVADGLGTRLRDLIGASRAAVRFQALAPLDTRSIASGC